MTTETFTERKNEFVTIDNVVHHEDGATLKLSNGFTMLSPVDSDSYTPGQDIVLEHRRFNDVGGVRLVDSGEWVFRRSDEHFEQQRAEWLEQNARQKRERLDANRDDWQKREDALPVWLRTRLQRFHEAGGETFELEGWGYELVICELAAVYARNGGADDEEITKLSSLNGTSGNQHDCAKALAAHQGEAALMPAGLSPLTGSADYSDPGPLRQALEKLKTRTEDLTDVEHRDLTQALSPFCHNFAELVTTLGSAVEGAVEAIDWNDLVAMITDDVEDEEELLPLRPFGEMLQEQVDAWSMWHTADVIEERKINPHLPGLHWVLRRAADELDPEGAALRKDGRESRQFLQELGK